MKCAAQSIDQFGVCSGPVSELTFPLQPGLAFAAAKIPICRAHIFAAGRVLDLMVADATGEPFDDGGTA